MIALRLLGPVELKVDGGPPPAELLWKKNLALLVYLRLSPRQTRSRDHLTGLLWGDKPESAARHSLNEALRVLRRAVGEEALQTDASAVRLDPGTVTLDLDAFAAHEAAQDWPAAAALVGGGFLEGFAVSGESGFEDWLVRRADAVGAPHGGGAGRGGGVRPRTRAVGCRAPGGGAGRCPGTDLGAGGRGAASHPCAVRQPGGRAWAGTRST